MLTLHVMIFDAISAVHSYPTVAKSLAQSCLTRFSGCQNETSCLNIVFSFEQKVCNYTKYEFTLLHKESAPFLCLLTAKQIQLFCVHSAATY